MSSPSKTLRTELAALQAWEESLLDILAGIRKNEEEIRRTLALDPVSGPCKIHGMKLTKADDLLYHLIGSDGKHLARVQLAAPGYAQQVELFFGIQPYTDLRPTELEEPDDVDLRFTHSYLCSDDMTRWDARSDEPPLRGARCPTCGRTVEPFASSDGSSESIFDQVLFNKANAIS